MSINSLPFRCVPASILVEELPFEEEFGKILLPSGRCRTTINDFDRLILRKKTDPSTSSAHSFGTTYAATAELYPVSTAIQGTETDDSEAGDLGTCRTEPWDHGLYEFMGLEKPEPQTNDRDNTNAAIRTEQTREDQRTAEH